MGAKTKHFGELLKELRSVHRLSLRKFCTIAEMDPGNISKIERGKSAPPQQEDILTKMALALKLEQGTSQWEDFFDTARISSGRLPDAVMSDEELMESLPVLLRTITGQKLTKQKFDELVERIKEN